jgi:hypothetical protein
MKKIMSAALVAALVFAEAGAMAGTIYCTGTKSTRNGRESVYPDGSCSSGNPAEKAAQAGVALPDLPEGKVRLTCTY